MAAFKMSCSCGDTMTVDAADRNGAVMQFKAMMDEAGIVAHMREKHPVQPVMTVEACHAMIERDVVAA